MSTKTSKYTTVMEASTYITCGSLVIALVYTMVRLRKGQKSAFLVCLTALLIVSNVTYIIYMGMYNDRHRLEVYAH